MPSYLDTECFLIEFLKHFCLPLQGEKNSNCEAIHLIYKYFLSSSSVLGLGGGGLEMHKYLLSVMELALGLGDGPALPATSLEPAAQLLLRRQWLHGPPSP